MDVKREERRKGRSKVGERERRVRWKEGETQNNVGGMEREKEKEGGKPSEGSKMGLAGETRSKNRGKKREEKMR